MPCHVSAASRLPPNLHCFPSSSGLLCLTELFHAGFILGSCREHFKLPTSSGKEGEGPLAGVNRITKSGTLLSKWKKTSLCIKYCRAGKFSVLCHCESHDLCTSCDSSASWALKRDNFSSSLLKNVGGKTATVISNANCSHTLVFIGVFQLFI